MKGLLLARRYYEEVGRPALWKAFPDLMPHVAAGLVGEGSECLGFDDEISRDHDFGPGFCLWLEKEDFEAQGEALCRAYDSLPGEFLGFPARKESARGAGRVGVLEISEFFGRFIGREQPPSDLLRWLYLPEEKLAILAGGEVFEDPRGHFSAIRDAIRAYYPEDVRIKKIAARAAGMAQSGQYNYGRAMRRRDAVAAALAKNEFIRQAMSMLYLLNRRYAPYYKWMYAGLSGLSLCPEAAGLLRELAAAGDQGAAWRGPHPAGWNPYLNLEDPNVRRIERICDLVIAELRRQGLTEQTSDFLEDHTEAIMSRIQDPALRRCHVLEG